MKGTRPNILLLISLLCMAPLLDHCAARGKGVEGPSDLLKEDIEKLRKENILLKGEIKGIKKELSILKGSLVMVKEDMEELQEGPPAVPLPILKLEPDPVKVEEEEAPEPAGEEEKGEIPELLEGFSYLLRGEYSRASDILTDYINKNPAGEMLEDAMYFNGVSYFLRGEYEMAVIHFTRLEQRFPSGNRYFDTLLQKARCYRQIGQKGDAVKLLQKIEKNCPDRELKAVAEKELQRLERGGEGE